MGEWTPFPLDQIADIVTGATPNPDDPNLWGDHLDFITPSDQESQSRSASPGRRISIEASKKFSRRIVPPFSTNLTCIGSTIGKVSMSRSPCLTNQQINSLIARPRVTDPVFLYYAIRNWSPILRREASGSATPIVNKTDLGQYQIFIPPLQRQIAIAEVLGALDDKIAANEQIIKVAHNLNAARVDSAARLLAPDRVGNTLSLSYGKALPTSKRNGGEVPVLGSGGEVGRHDEALVSEPGIVLGRKGTVGAVYWVDRPHFPIDTTYFVRPAPGVSPHILYYALQRIPFRELNSDSAVPGLNRDEAYAQPIRIPTGMEAEELKPGLEATFDLIAATRAETATLATTRDQLLPLLMSGKITVNQAEAQVADAL